MREEIWPDEQPVPFELTDHGWDVVRWPDVGDGGPVVWAGPSRSAEETARILTRDGRSLDEAQAAVRDYQDEASARLGVSVHAWGLDDADLAAIAETDVEARIPQQRAGEAEEPRRTELARWHSDDESAAREIDGQCLDREPS
jgi:hypothetical protein